MTEILRTTSEIYTLSVVELSNRKVFIIGTKDGSLILYDTQVGSPVTWKLKDSISLELTPLVQHDRIIFPIGSYDIEFYIFQYDLKTTKSRILKTVEVITPVNAAYFKSDNSSTDNIDSELFPGVLVFNDNQNIYFSTGNLSKIKEVDLERWVEIADKQYIDHILKTVYPVSEDFYLVSFYDIDNYSNPVLGYYTVSDDKVGFLNIKADHFRWVSNNENNWLITKNNIEDTVKVYRNPKGSTKMIPVYQLKLPKTSYWPLKSVAASNTEIAIPLGTGKISIHALTDGKPIKMLEGQQPVLYTKDNLYITRKDGNNYVLLQY